MTQRTAAVFAVDDALLASHPDLYGADSATRCLALARALASSPAWERLRADAQLVARPSAGLVAIIGDVAEDRSAAAYALGSQIPPLLRHLRPVGYEEVERACTDLASELRDRLGDEELQRRQLIGVPRGGLIVASLLAYLLGIPSDQVRGLEEADGPAILVDDCALSGLRLRESLRSCRSPEIVVALLHAHPALCRSVEAREPRVRLCVAARELEDHAPAREDYVAWKRRWIKRSPDDYWTGDPDHLCYRWNEPDALIWNEVLERAEAGWRVVPPEWCLKNLAESYAEDLQLCEAAVGPLSPAENVVWARTPAGTVVAGLSAGTPVLLNGSGAVIWQALIDTADPAAAAGRVAETYGIAHDAAADDVDRLVWALVGRGLLG